MISFILSILNNYFEVPHNCLEHMKEHYVEVSENDFVKLHKCKVCGTIV